MPGGSKEKGSNSSKSSDDNVLSRRKILLAGTSIAAATAIDAVDRTQVAQAQQPPQQPSAPSGRKPNILVIFGDDIGQTNVSAYSFGVMGLQDAEHRPHRPRRHDVHGLLRRTEVHGRALAAPFLAAQSVVGPFLATFKDYPPSQRPSSFSIDQVVEKMQKSFEVTQ